MERGVAHQAERMGILPKAEHVQNSLEWVKTSVSSQAVWFCTAEGCDQPHSCSFSRGATPCCLLIALLLRKGEESREVSSVMA